MAAPAARAQKLAELPPQLPADQMAEFTRSRAALDSRRQDLQARIEKHNATCGKVTSGSEQEKLCEQEQRRLNEDRERYLAEVTALNQRVGAAIVRLPFTAPVGSIAEIKGEVRVERPDGRTLTGPDLNVPNLTLASRIITGPNGGITLNLLDDHKLVLGPKTELVLDNAAPETPGGAGNLQVNLAHGILTLKNRALEKAQAVMHYNGVKLRTPTAVCGVRGTELEIFVAEDGSGHLKLLSGKMEVTRRKDGSSFTMEGRQQVKISADGSFTDPQPLP
jgi:hypothetical protein